MSSQGTSGNPAQSSQAASSNSRASILLSNQEVDELIQPSQRILKNMEKSTYKVENSLIQIRTRLQDMGEMGDIAGKKIQHNVPSTLSGMEQDFTKSRELLRVLGDITAELLSEAQRDQNTAEDSDLSSAIHGLALVGKGDGDKGEEVRFSVEELKQAWKHYEEKSAGPSDRIA